MSTRCCIEFCDGDAKVVAKVYKHSDGYPDGEHGMLALFKKVATSDLVWPLPRFEPDEFAAGFVAYVKESAGGIRLLDEALGDCEYIYTVEFSDGKLIVSVFDLHDPEWYKSPTLVETIWNPA